MATTYFNIDGVEKTGSTTPKQTPNQTLTAKCIVFLKPPCGALKIPTSRKEKRNLIKTRTACRTKMQLITAQPKRRQQVRHFYKAYWLLLKQGVSIATSKIENQQSH
jgi:hypothetical protein